MSASDKDDGELSALADGHVDEFVRAYAPDDPEGALRALAEAVRRALGDPPD